MIDVGIIVSCIQKPRTTQRQLTIFLMTIVFFLNRLERVQTDFGAFKIACVHLCCSGYIMQHKCDIEVASPPCGCAIQIIIK